MPASPCPLTVGYATASPEAAARLIAAQYEIGGPVICRLLHRGLNDVYAVTATAGGRFVLRLSGHRGRHPDDLRAETAFLAYLDSAGVPVATAVSWRSISTRPRRARTCWHSAGG